MTLSVHALEKFDICAMEKAEPVRVVGMCRCGEWHLSLANTAGVDLDEQIAFAFEAHEAGLT